MGTGWALEGDPRLPKWIPPPRVLRGGWLQRRELLCAPIRTTSPVSSSSRGGRRKYSRSSGNTLKGWRLVGSGTDATSSLDVAAVVGVSRQLIYHALGRPRSNGGMSSCSTKSKDHDPDLRIHWSEVREPVQ
jgi:hypothetical protein